MEIHVVLHEPGRTVLLLGADMGVVRWPLWYGYYVAMAVMTVGFCVGWQAFTWNRRGRGIGIVNRAFVISVIGQLIYVAWHLGWRWMVGEQVQNNWKFMLLNVGEMVQISFFAIILLYGSDMIHYYFIQYEKGSQNAEGAFTASMANLVNHPFRRIRVIAPLWLVFVLVWVMTLFLPAYLSNHL